MIINQISSKLWYIVQIYTIPKYIKKEIEKRIHNFLRTSKKSDFPDTQTLLEHFRLRDSIKLSKNKINSKIIKSHQCPLERSLFRQKQILRYNNRHKNLPKQNNEGFFFQLLNTWLHFTNNKFPVPMSMEEIPHQPIHLNPYTKLEFSSYNPCFYCIPSKNISDNYDQRPLQIPSTMSNLLYDI